MLCICYIVLLLVPLSCRRRMNNMIILQLVHQVKDVRRTSKWAIIGPKVKLRCMLQHVVQINSFQRFWYLIASYSYAATYSITRHQCSPRSCLQVGSRKISNCLYNHIVKWHNFWPQQSRNGSHCNIGGKHQSK